LPRVYILHGDLSEKHQAAIQELFREIEFIFHKANLRQFCGFRELHGEVVSYAKLLIPSIVSPSEQFVLYLDADVVVRKDLGKYPFSECAGRCISAVVAGKAESSLDWPLYREAGFDRDEKVFNSGVLLFNANRCRHFELLRKAIEAQHLYPIRRSADQPLFNIVFRGIAGSLPHSFNLHAGANKNLPDKNIEGIFHFVGSPKPWDAFGRCLHQNYEVFHEELRDLGVPWKQLAGRSSWRNLCRTGFVFDHIGMPCA
jgi:lipopolysaccharide biosynthesis glycosyltransferase